MISRELRTIFIHIPKTAGSSIEKKLGHFVQLKRGTQDHRVIRELEQPGSHWFNFGMVLRHVRYRKWSKASQKIAEIFNPPLTQQEYKDYFKFTFIRNPWSRMYSWYGNVMRDDLHKQAYNVPENCSLNEFVRNHVDHERFSQLYYLRDRRGKIPIDFIGRFENLEGDFTKVCEKIGLEDPHLPEVLRSGNENRYVDEYDDKTRDLVLSRYRDEIDYFGFEFES